LTRFADFQLNRLLERVQALAVVLTDAVAQTAQGQEFFGAFVNDVPECQSAGKTSQ
jgi:hypothetical protein